MLMITFGIITVTVMGLLIVSLISDDFSWIEKIGLSFPIGIGVQTLIMAFLDLCGIRLTAASVLSPGLLAILVIACLLFRRSRGQARPRLLQGFRAPRYSLAWLLFVGLVIYFEYMNFVKCMYFPTFDGDSLRGFDTIGYVTAQEHTFRHISLFQEDYVPGIHGPASYITYAPLTQLSYAFVYLLGTETSKLIPALMYLFFLIAFYGAMKRVSDRTCAAMATFLTLITPEMVAFSSLSATNVIHAVSASLGIIYIALWTKSDHRKDLLLGSLLLGLNVWTRTEGVVFIFAALLVVGFVSLKKRRWNILIPPLCAFIPALFWAFFCKVGGLSAESIAITHLFWDPDKASTVWNGMKSLCTVSQYYGITFQAFAVSLLCNAWFIWKKKDNLPLLAMIVSAFLLYMILLYQIDYKWDSIYNVLAYSAKRFLFCFIPLLWFYALTNRWVAAIFNKPGTALK